jgi:hypothetical protein
MGVDSIRGWLSKKTLLPIKMQWSQYGASVTCVSSYNFEVPLWPIEIGKEVRYTEEDTYIADGRIIKKEVLNRIRKVEDIEEITVPAGKFSSFKVVEYDEDCGEAVHTLWFSEKPKMQVKEIEYEEEATYIYELTSYSLNRA